MTVREYINTFEDAGLILAHIELVKDGKYGKETVDFDIDNDEIEDVKDQVDKLIYKSFDSPDPKVRVERRHRGYS